MGYPSADMAFNAEKLEKLMRHAKVTQQSIQTVSTWILDRRAWLNEIVDVWVRLLRESDASHQIVYLYIANDTMQVGVRKYGKHIAEMFEAKLLEVVQFVMGDCDEKVKRCMIKIIGIWKERHTVTPPLLDMLQNVCAGKPPVPEEPEKETLSVEDKVRTAHEAFVQEVESDATVEAIMSELTEVAEWDATAVMNQRLQDVVSATISADLLSDRMFQLESSLSTFQQAIEAYNETETRAESKDEEEAEEKSAGDIVWEMLDQQVFDVDVDRSREHVQTYRDNLEAQSAKREDLIQHLESLKLLDPFEDAVFHTSPLLRNQQAEALERLHLVCLKAEILEKEREAERKSAYGSRPPLIPTSASPRRGSSGGQDRMHEYRSSDPVESSYSQVSPHRPANLRRFSSMSDDYERRSDDRYGGDGDYKRPKLQHSQSLDDSRRDRPSRWDQSPRGSDRPVQFQEDGHGRDYRGDYGHKDRYEDRGRSPRHYGSSHSNHHDQGQRWESNRSYSHDDGRRDHQRRW